MRARTAKTLARCGVLTWRVWSSCTGYDSAPFPRKANSVKKKKIKEKVLWVTLNSNAMQFNLTFCVVESIEINPLNYDILNFAVLMPKKYSKLMVRIYEKLCPKKS